MKPDTFGASFELGGAETLNTYSVSPLERRRLLARPVSLHKDNQLLTRGNRAVCQSVKTDDIFLLGLVKFGNFAWYHPFYSMYKAIHR